MKWKGTVSQYSQRTIASKFASANASQASSTALRRSKPVTRMTDGFDRRIRAELLSQPADADVDDVRMRIEVIAPDLREQPLAADDLAGAFEQAVQELELAVGELDDPFATLHLAPCDVQRKRAGLQDVSALPLVRAPEMDANSRQELVERERLRQVVPRAEPEAVQLRRQVGPGRDDHDRQARVLRLERSEHAQPVEPRQQ